MLRQTLPPAGKSADRTCDLCVLSYVQAWITRHSSITRLGKSGRPLGTVPAHADDVAQVFLNAIDNGKASVGESFHAVSPAAMTTRGYAEPLATWFDQPARLRFVSCEDYSALASSEEASMCWDHLTHSSNCSIEKAVRVLRYQPRYSSLQAIRESLSWLTDHGKLTVLSQIPRSPGWQPLGRPWSCCSSLLAS